MSESIDSRGVFGKSLVAASDANRFRNPSLAPGERTSAIEEQLLLFEQSFSDNMARALELARLTDAERDDVVGRTLAFLSGRDVAAKRGVQSPDVLAFVDELEMLLARFGVLERERAEVVREVTAALESAQIRLAA